MPKIFTSSPRPEPRRSQPDSYHQPDSVEALTERNVKTIAELEKAAQAQHGRPQWGEEE